MKISYEFADGSITEVEVSDEIGAVVIDSRREEESAERKHRRHCISLDAIVYEGKEYGREDTHPGLEDEDDAEQALKLRTKRAKTALRHLTEMQRRYLWMHVNGLSVREISRREAKNFRTVYDSIEAAKKKFEKFYFRQ